MGTYTHISIKGKLRKYAIIGCLSEKKFFSQLVNFIGQVLRMKNLSKENQQQKDDLLKGVFNPEFSGTKNYNLTSTVHSNCDHGLVISALQKALVEHQWKAHNTKQIDLLGFKPNLKYPTFLFEAKTNISTQSIYTAVGQLMMYSLSISNGIQKVMVLPGKIPDGLIQDLKKLDITVLAYQWKNQHPVFPNLQHLLKQS